MECLSYQAAYEFITAWKIHDTAALRLSTSANVALKNGKPYYTPTLALKAETDEYIRRLEIFAEELGVNHVHLIRSLLELRRDGVDYTKAVQSVIDYVEAFREAS